MEILSAIFAIVFAGFLLYFYFSYRKIEKDDNQRKEARKARDLAKETYKKARSSKDDKEYSHPTEHDESDDLEMVKAIKEKE